MYQKGRKLGSTRFALRMPGAGKVVAVAGDFSGWRPIPMKRQKNGQFVRHTETPTGMFEYKFIVDGQWMPDPDNPHLAPDSYGGFNSVAVPDGAAVTDL